MGLGPMEFMRDAPVCKVFVESFRAGPPPLVTRDDENVDENESTDTGGVNILASLSPMPENTPPDGLEGSMSIPEAVNTLDSSSCNEK